VLVASCRFLDRLLFTPMPDAFSLSPADACLRSRWCFRFRLASLPVFCCWVSSSFWFVFGLLHVSWRGGLETFNLVVLRLCLLNCGVRGVVVVMCSGGGGDVDVWWWWGFSKRGGWCCLGEEVGAFVAVVVGDSFWRLSLLFRSIFVIATSFEFWVA